MGLPPLCQLSALPLAMGTGPGFAESPRDYQDPKPPGLPWGWLGKEQRRVPRPPQHPCRLQVPLEAGARPHPAPRAAGGNPGRPSYNAALPVPEGPPSTEKAPRADGTSRPRGDTVLPHGTSLSSPPGARFPPGSWPAAPLCIKKYRNTIGAAG